MVGSASQCITGRPPQCMPLMEPPAGTSTDGVQLLKLVASCTGSTPARRPASDGGAAPGTSAGGVQLVQLAASCTGSTPARRPVLAGKQTGHITGPYAACMQRGSTAHTARKKCEQRARGGATTAQRRAHRREGVGGAFLSFYALQTSSGTTLHARNFFQKSQLYRLRI